MNGTLAIVFPIHKKVMQHFLQLTTPIELTMTIVSVNNIYPSLSLLQNCPNNIRKRVPQTQFSEIFLHSIPVLQWAKHFSPEEYQRLSHYGGAHGWGSVDIEGVCVCVFCTFVLEKQDGKCHCLLTLWGKSRYFSDGTFYTDCIESKVSGSN